MTTHTKFDLKFLSESKESEDFYLNPPSAKPRNKSSPSQSVNSSREDNKEDLRSLPRALNPVSESVEKFIASSQHTEELSSSEWSMRETRSERGTSEDSKTSRSHFKRHRYMSVPKDKLNVQKVMKKILEKNKLEEEKVPDWKKIDKENEMSKAHTLRTIDERDANFAINSLMVLSKPETKKNSNYSTPKRVQSPFYEIVNVDEDIQPVISQINHDKANQEKFPEEAKSINNQIENRSESADTSQDLLDALQNFRQSMQSAEETSREDRKSLPSVEDSMELKKSKILNVSNLNESDRESLPSVSTPKFAAKPISFEEIHREESIIEELPELMMEGKFTGQNSEENSVFLGIDNKLLFARPKTQGNMYKNMQNNPNDTLRRSLSERSLTFSEHFIESGKIIEIKSPEEFTYEIPVIQQKENFENQSVISSIISFPEKIEKNEKNENLNESEYFSSSDYGNEENEENKENEKNSSEKIEKNELNEIYTFENIQKSVDNSAIEENKENSEYQNEPKSLAESFKSAKSYGSYLEEEVPVFYKQKSADFAAGSQNNPDNAFYSEISIVHEIDINLQNSKENSQILNLSAVDHEIQPDQEHLDISPIEIDPKSMIESLYNSFEEEKIPRNSVSDTEFYTAKSTKVKELDNESYGEVEPEQQIFNIKIAKPDKKITEEQIDEYPNTEVKKSGKKSKKKYMRIPSQTESEENFKEQESFKTTGTMPKYFEVEEHKNISEEIQETLTFEEALKQLWSIHLESNSQLWREKNWINKVLKCCVSAGEELSEKEEAQCEQFLKFSALKFNKHDPFHKALLCSYYTLSSGECDGSINIGIWNCIGFTSSFPENDLYTDCGVFGLLQLLYFSSHFKSCLSDILIHSRMPPHNFSLVKVSIEISKICINELKNKKLNILIRKSNNAPETIFLFYVGILLSWFEFYTHYNLTEEEVKLAFKSASNKASKKPEALVKLASRMKSNVKFIRD